MRLSVKTLVISFILYKFVEKNYKQQDMTEEIPYTPEEVKAMVQTIRQLRKENAELIDKAQRTIDIESLEKWAIDNSFIPFDFYNDTEGIENDRVVSFYDLMDYLKTMEE